MRVKVEFSVSTKYVGSEVREELEIDFDDDFTPEEIEVALDEEFEEWLHNVTYQGWRIID